MTTTEEKARMVDEDTGIVYELTPLNAKARRGSKPLPNAGFTQVWMPQLWLLEKSVSSGAFRVFCALCEFMEPRSGVVKYELDALQELLDVRHSTTVSNMISELVKVGAVAKLRRAKVAINPEIAWKGSASDRSVALFKWANLDTASNEAIVVVDGHADPAELARAISDEVRKHTHY